jgi:hypothetical protein
VPLSPVPMSEPQTVEHYYSPMLSHLSFLSLSFFSVYNVHMYIFLHILLYKKICALTFSCSRSPSRSELGFLVSS